jgi:hypothetical protein
MIHELLPILPTWLSQVGVAACIAGLFGGAILWLTGAAWSRWVVTLLSVAAGGYFGEMLPRWYIWPVNSMALAVLGAVVLGVLAFVGHRVFVGIVLGVVLVAWACFGTWILLRGDQTLQPRQDWEINQLTVPQYAQDLWRRLPEPVSRVMPYAAATAMISGLCITLLWPRIGRTMMGSTLGLSIVLLCGLTLVQCERSWWLKFIPLGAAEQAAVLAGSVLLGMLVQWQILPSRKEVRVLEQQRQQEQTPIRRYGEITAT